jgi:hypothetical protein
VSDNVIASQHACYLKQNIFGLSGTRVILPLASEEEWIFVTLANMSTTVKIIFPFITNKVLDELVSVNTYMVVMPTHLSTCLNCYELRLCDIAQNNYQ